MRATSRGRGADCASSRRNARTTSLCETYLAELERSRGALDVVVARRRALRRDDRRRRAPGGAAHRGWAHAMASWRPRGGDRIVRGGDRRRSGRSPGGARRGPCAASTWTRSTRDGKQSRVPSMAAGTKRHSSWSASPPRLPPAMQKRHRRRSARSSDQRSRLWSLLRRSHVPAWAFSEADADALSAALERLAAAGAEASTMAAAEEHRRARAVGDAERVLDASRAWFQGGRAAPRRASSGSRRRWRWGAPTRSKPRAARSPRPVPPDLREALLASASLLHVAANPEERRPAARRRVRRRSPREPGAGPARAATPAAGSPRSGISTARWAPTPRSTRSSLAGWSWLVDGNVAEALRRVRTRDAARIRTTWRRGKGSAPRRRRPATPRSAPPRARPSARRARTTRAPGASGRRPGLACDRARRPSARRERLLPARFARDATRGLAFDRLFRPRSRAQGQRPAPRDRRPPPRRRATTRPRSRSSSGSRRASCARRATRKARSRRSRT